jgi:hypothetical protein
VLTNQSDYSKNRNYWKYLKDKLKKENNQVVSVTTQLKFLAPDGKLRLADMLDYEGIIALGKTFPGTKANKFIDWFTYSPESIDGKSKTKAYALFENSFVDSLEVGTAKGLQQIHAYIFGGLYDFAGQLRTKNIAKGGYRFEYANHLSSTLLKIDTMPETNFDEMVEKYQTWLDENNLPQMSADELLVNESVNLTKEQRKYIQNFSNEWDEEQDKYAKGGYMADGGLVVNSDEDLHEIAKYMVKAIKKRADFKDLVYYFEKDNNYDYNYRVKIWDEMNVYEMKKTEENVYKVLK